MKSLSITPILTYIFGLHPKFLPRKFLHIISAFVALFIIFFNNQSSLFCWIRCRYLSAGFQSTGIPSITIYLRLFSFPCKYCDGGFGSKFHSFTPHFLKIKFSFDYVTEGLCELLFGNYDKFVGRLTRGLLDYAGFDELLSSIEVKKPLPFMGSQKLLRWKTLFTLFSSLIIG